MALAMIAPVLSVPKDTHMEYPANKNSNTLAQKIGSLTYGQLIMLLATDKHEYQRLAAKEIGVRSYSDPEAPEHIYQEGGITQLVDLLGEDHSLMLQFSAIQALINVALDEQSRVDIVEAGGLKRLLELLESENQDLVRHATWCLVNLLRSRNMKDMAREEGVMGKLGRLFKTNAQETRPYVAMLVCNLLDDAPRQNLIAFQKAGLLVPLFTWLVKFKSDRELCRLVLASIYHLINEKECLEQFQSLRGLQVITKMLSVSDTPENLYIITKIIQILSSDEDRGSALIRNSPTLVQTLISLLRHHPCVFIKLAATESLSNLAVHRECRSTVVKENSLRPVCDLLVHDFEDLARASAALVNNLCADSAICLTIGSFPHVARALVRLTLPANSTPTQQTALSCLTYLLRNADFGRAFLVVGGVERLGRLARMHHNPVVHQSAMTCVLLMSAHHIIVPSLVPDIVAAAIEAIVNSSETYVHYCSVLSLVALLEHPNAEEGVSLRAEKILGKVGAYSEYSAKTEWEEVLCEVAADLASFLRHAVASPVSLPVGQVAVPPQQVGEPVAPAIADTAVVEEFPPSAFADADPAGPAEGSMSVLPPLAKDVAEVRGLGDSIDGSADGHASPASGSIVKWTLKCIMGKTVKMMRVPSSISVEELNTMIGAKFGMDVDSLKFKDDDGDLVSLEGADDMEFMAECFDLKPKRKLEVYIEGKEVVAAG
eukprot:CAMPEP_0119125136 /NCGR_PEP_ID=MMETSP1310-20130426/4507_1 /TAXON_ID=464262 /ORGANISM="Genus nov. species nov., Strain RCC2339" /LENGTH=714 /DNA_ID=CAMNT_0007115175 /DNA_START=56 /DNA_END=2197 /DNA_ORIENTATION=-